MLIDLDSGWYSHTWHYFGEPQAFPEILHIDTITAWLFWIYPYRCWLWSLSRWEAGGLSFSKRCARNLWCRYLSVSYLADFLLMILARILWGNMQRVRFTGLRVVFSTGNQFWGTLITDFVTCISRYCYIDCAENVFIMELSVSYWFSRSSHGH